MFILADRVSDSSITSRRLTTWRVSLGTSIPYRILPRNRCYYPNTGNPQSNGQIVRKSRDFT